MDYAPFSANLSRGSQSWDVVSPILRSDSSHDRFADIKGRDLQFVMPALGWKYSPSQNDTGVLLLDPSTHTPLAAALCLRIRTGRTYGANITYLCPPEHEGKGLCKVAAAMAVSTFCETHLESGYKPHEEIKFVNIQYRASNAASAGLALRLGFTREPSLDLRVKRPQGDPLDFQTCRASLADAHRACLQILWDEPANLERDALPCP